MYHGEFTGLSGGANFYAQEMEGLEREGVISLRVHLGGCAEQGIEPYARQLALAEDIMCGDSNMLRELAKL